MNYEVIFRPAAEEPPTMADVIAANTFLLLKIKFDNFLLCHRVVVEEGDGEPQKWQPRDICVFLR